MNDTFYVYILFSKNHSQFYIGQTHDFSKRLSKHNSGGVRSTNPYKPWELVGLLEKSTRGEALILEKKLKNLHSEDLKKFICKYFNKQY